MDTEMPSSMAVEKDTAALPPMQVGVLAPQPGDVIVIKCDKVLSQKQRDCVVDSFAPYLPVGVRAMVLEAGFDLLLIKGADAAV